MLQRKAQEQQEWVNLDSTLYTTRPAATAFVNEVNATGQFASLLVMPNDGTRASDGFWYRVESGSSDQVMAYVSLSGSGGDLEPVGPLLSRKTEIQAALDAGTISEGSGVRLVIAWVGNGPARPWTTDKTPSIQDSFWRGWGLVKTTLPVDGSNGWAKRPTANPQLAKFSDRELLEMIAKATANAADLK
jgi:hypothetical protein